MRIRQTASLFFALFANLVATSQQVITPDSYSQYSWDFERLMDRDSSELMLHYTIKSHGADAIQLLNPLVRLSYNSTLPYGYDDGAVWRGVGYNMEAHAGISGSKGIFSYTFQPVFFFAQNAPYQLVRLSQSANAYNYQFIPGRIDWVQRYGDKPYAQINPGQSAVKVAKWGFQVSVGTQNFKVGPAIHFPILMSNNAPGLPYLNIGTDGGQMIHFGELEIGEFESNFIYARMKESPYFDEDDSNDNRYYNSMHYGFSPAILPELTIGFNRVLYKQSRYWALKDLGAPFFDQFQEVKVVNGDTITSPNDFFDQMASITMEWKFPTENFRVYGEYAVNDHTNKTIEPEHSRAYVLGLQKLFSISTLDLIIAYEHANLSRGHTYRYRPEPTFYQHYFSRQGYTNNGQIVGSSTGPGSTADHVELKVRSKTKQFLVGMFYRRTEFDKDYFSTHNPDSDKHHIGLDIGLKAFIERDHLIFGLEGVHTYQFNRYYVEGNNKRNFYVGFSALAKINQ